MYSLLEVCNLNSSRTYHLCLQIGSNLHNDLTFCLLQPILNEMCISSNMTTALPQLRKISSSFPGKALHIFKYILQTILSVILSGKNWIGWSRGSDQSSPGLCISQCHRANPSGVQEAPMVSLDILSVPHSQSISCKTLTQLRLPEYRTISS